MAFRVVRPDDLRWLTRRHAPDEPARHVAELGDAAGSSQIRVNVWRYEPGATGRRHRHPLQDETFVVLAGTLSMYVGDPPERQDVPTGGLIHVEHGTALQAANHGDRELVLYAQRGTARVRARRDPRPGPVAPRTPSVRPAGPVRGGPPADRPSP